MPAACRRGRAVFLWPRPLLPAVDFASMDNNLHSLTRQLIELRIEHADLDNLIDQAALDRPSDELSLRRLKKRRLLLRDRISRLEADIEPPEPA